MSTKQFCKAAVSSNQQTHFSVLHPVFIILSITSLCFYVSYPPGSRTPGTQLMLLASRKGHHVYHCLTFPSDVPSPPVCLFPPFQPPASGSHPAALPNPRPCPASRPPLAALPRRPPCPTRSPALHSSHADSSTSWHHQPANLLVHTAWSVPTPVPGFSSKANVAFPNVRRPATVQCLASNGVAHKFSEPSKTPVPGGHPCPARPHLSLPFALHSILAVIPFFSRKDFFSLLSFL